METLLKCVHMVAALFLVLVVLVQSGRGGGVGGIMGAASGQIFGGRGAGNFLSRLTSGAAIVFFTTSLTLSMLASRHASVLAGQEAVPGSDEATLLDDEDEDPGNGDGDSDAAPAAPAATPATAPAAAP